MHRSSPALLLVAAALGGAAGCAEAPPAGPRHPSAQQQPPADSRSNGHARGATLSQADATAEVAYYRERSLALAGEASTEIARTDFTRLRRGRLYLTEGLPDREIE